MCGSCIAVGLGLLCLGFRLLVFSAPAARAAVLNKLATDPSPTWGEPYRSATDLGARSSGRGRCGGGGVPVAEFCPPAPPSRRRALRRCCGAWEVVQEQASGRGLLLRRRRVLAMAVHGVLGGGCWKTEAPAPGLWKMAGGSVSLLRRRRAEVAVPEFDGGFGARPRPTSHKVIGFAYGELLLRSTKLMASEGSASSSGVMDLLLPFFRWPSWRCQSWGASEGEMHKELQGPVCMFCFLGVLCVSVLGHLLFWCLLSFACVSCNHLCTT